MALAIDASSPAVAVGSGTVTTASFTPPGDSVVLVAIAANSVNNFLPVAPTITDNLGAHLGYTLSNWVSERDDAAISGQCAMWSAWVTASAAMTISVTVDPSNPDVAIKVWVITGADPIDWTGAAGKAGSTSASSIAQSYTGLATSGQGFLVACDWDALGNPTAGSGCSINAGTIGGQISYGFARRTVADDTLGGTNTLNVTLPGSSTNLFWCWQEILPLFVDEDLIDPPPVIVCRPPGIGAPNGWLNPWMGMDDAPPQPLWMRVTATEGGVTNNGMSLCVKMLTGAAAVQNGVSNSTTTITTPSLAVTPAASGSWVYGALINANSTTVWTANANTTFAINSADVTNGAVYGNYRSTNVTVASTPVTLGASAPTGAASGGLAQAEIKANANGLIEDSGAPAGLTTTGATTLSTPTFIAVPGSLLVATVCADSGAGVVTITVAGGGLAWTEIVKANGSSAGYAGVWIARVPGEEPRPQTGVTRLALAATGLETLPAGATAETGAAALALVATGAAVRVASVAGSAELAVRSTGAAIKVAKPVGAATTALRSTGAAARVAAPVGSATVALRSTSAAAHSQAGAGRLALTSSGLARRTALPTGAAEVALRTGALAAHGQAGAAEMALRTSGAAVRVASVVASSRLAVRAGGSAVKVAPQAGDARLALAATGQETTAAARAQSGSCAIAARATAGATKIVSRAGAGTLALRGTGSGVHISARAGAARVALLATGAQVSGVARVQSGACQLALTSAGAARKVVTRAGSAAVALRCTSSARKTAAAAARSVLALTGSGAAGKRAPVVGRALVLVFARPVVTGVDVRSQAGTVRLGLRAYTHICVVRRPGSGLITRPAAGVVVRPGTGLIVAGGGIVVRPFTGTVPNEC
jgi:hypothetical protein